MRTPLHRRAALTAAGLALFATPVAALAHGGEDHKAKRKNVEIRFAAFAGATPVACGTPIAGLGTTGATAQLKDLRFYISNVALVRKNGSVANLKLKTNDAFNLTKGDRTTLIDLENGAGMCDQGDAATNAVIRGTVPAGEYTGVRMYMGVPFKLNHTDTPAAPKPLDISAMNWSWQSGRKFAKIEVTDPAGTAGTWKAKTFNFHLGSTGCVGNPASGATVSCSASNRMAFHFDAFNPARQRIAVDVKALLAGNDITVNRAGAPGCMAGGTDPECAAVFQALQVDWKPDGTGTGASIGGGHTQTLFRVVKR